VLSKSQPSVVIGVDVGDRSSRFCVLEAVTGEELRKGRMATSTLGLDRLLSRYRDARVVIEVGTHSAWMSRHIAGLGRDVVVANARKLRMIYASDRKNDEIDAEMLARVGRVDLELLKPIQHRSLEAQSDVSVLRARAELVGCRSKLINSVRGTVKSFGARLPRCSAESFHKAAADKLPSVLEAALTPLLEQIQQLTSSIRDYDKLIESIAKRYPPVERLQEVTGVGPITALCYVLTLEEPKRFKSGRSVGAYLGLCPKLDDSGDQTSQLPISKAGDVMLRALLVNCAHYIMGPFGPDCDLRRHGLKLTQRGGQNAKKRAVVAVARKLAVLLFALWTKDTPYEPLCEASREDAEPCLQA
jgi:transposase